jgi:hypothetical protein
MSLIKHEPKYPKITSPMAVCLDSHTGPLGTFKEGDLVASSNRDVIEHPGLWAPAGLPTEEYHQLRQQRFTALLVDLEEQSLRPR